MPRKKDKSLLENLSPAAQHELFAYWYNNHCKVSFEKFLTQINIGAWEKYKDCVKKKT